jgi:hypothetical protein
MVDKVERERRKVLLRAIKSEELITAEKELPAPKPLLDLLFDWLDQKLGETECDNTLRLTLEFAKLHDLGEKRLCDWTEEYGGYCDCEVLANVPDSNPVFRS